MIVKKEFRQERDDVFSFWEIKKALNELDQIIEVEEKIDECTVIMLENKIADLEKQVDDLMEKITLEQDKIDMIKLL
jgi:coenzyme F420-reducing hydrogenase delta subunit